jgi:hypothetical protein
MPTPETCPNCGADVPPRATACPECGADEKTGWSEEAYASGLDLPEENFNYDEYVKKEFGPRRHVPQGLHWVWWLVGVLLLAALISLWVFR